MPSYLKLIESEKKYSEIFFKKNSMNNTFDEREYEFISKIFSDNFDLCCNVWKVIEKVSSGYAFDKYLILSDFFFSICTFKIDGDEILIFKISRDEYVSYMVKRALIYYTDFEFEYYSYIETHKKLLIGFQLSNVLKKSEIRTLSTNNL